MDIKDIVREKVNHAGELKSLRHYRVEPHITEKGQFLIKFFGKEAWVTINHAWGNEQRSYDSPGPIEILLTNQTERTSHVIYMTELDIRDFPDLLDEAVNIAYLFLAGKYEKVKEKNVFRKRKLLYFNEAIGVYKYANELKKYIDYPKN